MNRGRKGGHRASPSSPLPTNTGRAGLATTLEDGDAYQIDSSILPFSSAGTTVDDVPLDSFSDINFNLNSLIDSITSSALNPMGNDRRIGDKGGNSGFDRYLGDFNPRPHIYSLESLGENLKTYRKTVFRELRDLEDECALQDARYKNTLTTLTKSFTEVYSSFDTLESRVSEVANTAVCIGEQLETIDKQRANAAAVRDLLLFFMDFNQGITTRLDALRSNATSGDSSFASGNNGGLSASLGASSGVAAAAFSSGASSVIGSSYKGGAGSGAAGNTAAPVGDIAVAIIIRRLLHIARHVDSAGTEQARTEIEKYAANFETELLERFHQASEDRNVAKMKVCTDTLLEFNGGENCLKGWINKHPLFTTPLADVSTTVEDPDKPDPDFVALLRQLKSAIYRDWEIISAVFVSPHTLLFTLIQRFFQQLVQSYVSNLLELSGRVSDIFYLKTLASILRAANQIATEMREFDEKVLGKKIVVTTIERCIDDVFVPFNNTTEREKRHMESIMTEEFSEALIFYASRKTTKKGLFSRTQKPAQQVNLHMLLSVDSLMRVLTADAEAIDRCILLHSEPHMAVSELFLSLCSTVFAGYIEPALDTRIEELATVDTKTEPDLSMLQLVQIVLMLTHTMQTHFEQRVLPVLSSYMTTLRLVIDKKTSYLRTIERKCNKIVSSLASASVSYAAQCLTKQRKTDYKEREGGPELDVLQVSPTCSLLCTFLNNVYNEANSYLDSENMTAFLRQIGMHCAKMLLEHFKCFPVSQTGVLILSRDLAHYQACASKFKVPELNSRFAFLREIGNLFLVKPENLKSILEEGMLASLEKNLVTAYLTNRSDYKSAKIERLLAKNSGFDDGVDGLLSPELNDVLDMDSD